MMPSIIKSIRRITAPARLLPDFLIIGAQRSGTTSLFQQLMGHPCIGVSAEKEVHYFDLPSNFKKGTLWYRSHFPTVLRKSYYNTALKKPLITDESSPYYLFYPHAPKRIARLLPHAKLIVLLRNPVDRAYSHYQHEVRTGAEKKSFEETIKTHERKLGEEMEKVQNDENYYSFNHQRFSYLHRGIYWKQLIHWFSFFPREQFLILSAESYFNDPASTFEKVVRFLDLPQDNLKDLKIYHKEAYTSNMSEDMRIYLSDYYKPHNRKLYECLGINFGWS